MYISVTCEGNKGTKNRRRQAVVASLTGLHNLSASFFLGLLFVSLLNQKVRKHERWDSRACYQSLGAESLSGGWTQ